MSQRTMRAARYYEAGRPVRMEEIPYPEAGPDQVVVRVAACGICGSDLHFFHGMPTLMPLPMTLGHEPAGVIEALGQGVDGWAPGDRVAVHIGRGCGQCRTCRSGHETCCPSISVPGLHTDGAFAEAVCVPRDCLVRIPDGVSFAVAAVATDCVASPYHALTCRGGLVSGERVAVFGVGGLGNQAVCFAKLLGAAQVVAVDVSEVALARASRAGASDLLLVEPGEDPATRIKELTDGGVDLVLECVGTPATVASGVNALHPGGRLVVVGVGLEPPRIDLPQAVFSFVELSLLGSFGSHAEDLEHVLRLQADGEIDIEVSISHRLSLDRVAEGLEMLDTKRGDPERIVIELDV